MPPPAPVIPQPKKPSSQPLDGVKKTLTVILTGAQVNLKDMSRLPFSKEDLNNAIKDLAQRIVEKRAKQSI